MNYEDFLYFKKSSFISFFINNFIDIPICFKKSKSLRFKNFELPVLKFSNYIMKKGMREQTLVLLFSSFRNYLKTDNVFNSNKKSYRIKDKVEFKNTFFFEKYNEKYINWLYLFFSINGIFWSQRNNKQIYFNVLTPINLNSNNVLYNNDKWIDVNFFIKTNLLLKLNKVLPIFSYFIYSVDKNIKKYSRGKSGKYVFVWKYVAYYKRIYIAMRWIVKEMKFNNDKKISNRIIKTLTNLENDLESSFAWKSKVFSHNYVFKNFKKTLMVTLKTTV